MENNIHSDEILSNVKIVENLNKIDNRGSFLKFYSNEIKENFNIDVTEVFYSKNKQNVIRGVHFQRPPGDLAKIIKCIDGLILDFFIDLRKDSETFGKFSSIELSSENNLSLYIPKGFGHGFSVLSQTATVLYLQSGEYNTVLEGGINPLSIDFNWRVENPIISERDSSHPNFQLDNNIFKL